MYSPVLHDSSITRGGTKKMKVGDLHTTTIVGNCTFAVYSKRIIYVVKQESFE
jgi:hypothetical protein